MKISEFVFEKGRIVSLYGASGSGKTNIILQVITEITPSLYISTEGKSYYARIENLKAKKDVYYTESNSVYELILSIIKSANLNLKLIAVDTINRFYRETRKEKDIEYPLILLSAWAYENNIKVLLSWQVSGNNRVSGEKFMRKVSEDVLRVTKNYIIGNLRVCKFKIVSSGVEGCL
ncbi:AAA family ATPase [Sulfurisphaera javensis]|uniref:AAA family ATPase n=1 Tax=Sulfurisphaera javensis TaxID=2049879 RepID=A0AAT9GRL8_9CREN